MATVHYEAARAGLDPQLVLGVIQHESNFRKYAISSADARGYMQVMPFWTRLIGSADAQSLSPAHQPSLRLRDPAPLPRHRERRPLSRARTLQRQPRPARISECRAGDDEPQLAVRAGGDAEDRSRAGILTRRGERPRRFRPRPPYRGRYAPSPTGPLHFGSLVAAVASYCDARAAGGEWLVRIEDVDLPRSQRGAERRDPRHARALRIRLGRRRRAAIGAHRCSTPPPLERLRASGDVYECACSRRELEDGRVGAGGERVYPGTCRDGIPADRRGTPSARCRVRVGDARVEFRDRLQGAQAQDLARDVGDFVVRRADGLYAYQLAVVVDDALQGVTHVVRGADLLASTPRQIFLAAAARIPAAVLPARAVAINRRGRKALEADRRRAAAATIPLPALLAAWRFLGQPLPEGSDAPGDAGGLLGVGACALEPGAAAADRDASGAARGSRRARRDGKV